MIEIVKEKKSTKKSDPFYTLTYQYMIGDADGETSETTTLSLNNPFIERYVTLLNSLKPTKGTWGLMLQKEDIKKCFKEKQISEDDYNFLCRMMFQDKQSDFLVPINYESYAYEFYEGVRADTEYSFLVFEGCDLRYIDEYGKKHKTRIV